ncbi:hypothetical protein [Pseudomonas synxantha]|uniref:hypothetical protein n=1 Tax=Pseudomonas synxantha TaxID=47883 RepID=UPI0010FE33C3|nr:hypothetical protein [Pseudomonas synxantha]
MIPSAAPYSVTWNTERQVATRSPLIERAFFRLLNTPELISSHGFSSTHQFTAGTAFYHSLHINFRIGSSTAGLYSRKNFGTTAQITQSFFMCDTPCVVELRPGKGRSLIQ